MFDLEIIKKKKVLKIYSRFSVAAVRLQLGPDHEKWSGSHLALDYHLCPLMPECLSANFKSL